jgi:hypothetical protein
MTLPRSRTSKRGTWWLHEVFPQMLEKLKRAYELWKNYMKDIIIKERKSKIHKVKDKLNGK